MIVDGNDRLIGIGTILGDVFIEVPIPKHEVPYTQGDGVYMALQLDRLKKEKKGDG